MLRTARGASISSEELNAEEVPNHQDQLQEH